MNKFLLIYILSLMFVLFWWWAVFNLSERISRQKRKRHSTPYPVEWDAGNQRKSYYKGYPAYNEYYVEYRKGDEVFCKFGILAGSVEKVKELVEIDIGGVVTQVAIRTPEKDSDGVPSYEIVFRT